MSSLNYNLNAPEVKLTLGFDKRSMNFITLPIVDKLLK